MSEVPVFPLIIVGLLILIGAALLIGALWIIIRSVTQRWQTVEGVIQDLEFAPIEGERACVVMIVFRYHIGEDTYLGRHIASEIPNCVSDRDREAISRHYPQGKPITVYYPVHNPLAAQLDARTDDTVFMLFVLAGTGLIALIIAFVWGRNLLPML